MVPRAYVLLGSLEDARGNRPQAQKWYEKALQLQPDQALAANNLAFLMLETGQNVNVALTLAQTARREHAEIAQLGGYPGLGVLPQKARVP